MRRLARLSLRARLAVAMVSVAVLPVALATLLANRGLKPLVTDAANARLQPSAFHMAELAGAVYTDESRWTAQARDETRVDPAGDPEFRAVAQALSRLAETLEQEEEVRKHTVADLAHGLRTPVNGLLARIEAGQDGVLTGPDISRPCTTRRSD